MTTTKAPTVSCAYCGRHIGAMVVRDPATGAAVKFYRRGYGQGDAIRFCALSTCALRFALAAHRGGYRMAR